MKKNVLLVDSICPSDWNFLRGLQTGSREEWEIVAKDSCRYSGSISANIRRWFIFFFFPLRIVLKRNCYHKILAWQQFYGLNFAFWMRLLGLRKRQKLIIMTFIYKKKKGFVGRIYHRYMAFIVKSHYVDKFICFSKDECGYYSNLFNTPIERFKYVPLGIDYFKTDMCQCVSDKYVFSTGRSNRDYDFLINSFLDSDYKLYIACGDLKQLDDKYNNIVIDTKCYRNDMLKKMAGCYCVIISVRDTKVSAGQLVAIQAMQLGKPVIATASDGLKDYVEDGVTGILINKNTKDLMNALDRLYSDKNYYNFLSTNSKKVFEEKYTLEKLGQNVGEICNSVKGVIL